MVRYLVTFKTRKGGRAGAGVFKTKAIAKKFIKKTSKDKAFRKLGYSNLRIRKDRDEW